MSRWYYARGGRSVGPVSLGELQRLAEDREITPADMVFREGSAGWVPASSVAELFGRASAVATLEAVPVEPEPIFLEAEDVVAGHPAPPGEDRPGGDWWRFCLLFG